MKLVTELSEFDIKYESRVTLKAQVLTNVIVEMSLNLQEGTTGETWKLHDDDSSNYKRSAAELILENDDGLGVQISLTFSFTTSNIRAEYEACIARLRLE